jgi:RimJ/RimL family protein N-acetyltransferase
MELQDTISTVPNFDATVVETFKRYPDRETCTIISLDPKVIVSDEDINTITAICSEPRVFKLFAHIPKFANGYTTDHAKGFVASAQKGWQENTKFTFLVRNPEGRIVACLDIKSNNLDDSEIGYWASELYPGVMTNSVIKLCDIARKAGYKHLHALVRLENDKSKNVVKRAGLQFAKTIVENETPYNRFEIDL